MKILSNTLSLYSGHRCTLAVMSIFLIGLILRLFGLAHFPPQLNRDEAALAINAFYIQQAGVDEWGTQYPLQFKSFGDFKLPGYIYILSLLFNFQVNDFIVRLPSALAGSFLPLATWFWISRLIKVNKYVSFFILLTLTFSPFSFFYSRMAWEANVALTLMVTALALFHHKTFHFGKDTVGIALYTLAVLTYNSPLILLPFVILTIPLVRGVKKYKEWIFLISSLTVLFILFMIILSQNNAQKSGIVFFTDPSVLANYPDYRAQFPVSLKKLFGNKLMYFIGIATDHYVRTFGPEFLIQHGGQHPWHSILGRGHIYWTTYLLFIIGFVSQSFWLFQTMMIRTKKSLIIIAPRFVLLFLLLISPLPAIITTDAPHATRSLFTFILILVFSAFGFEKVLELSQKFLAYKRIVVVTAVSLLLLVESGYYFYQYFYIWPPVFSSDLKVTFKDHLLTTTQQYPTGPIAIIDNGIYLYALVAWYMKIPVSDVISSIKRDGPDTAHLYYVSKLDRYYFYHSPQEKPGEFPIIIEPD